MMAKVHMMIGIPGSGKTTKAKEIAEKEKAIWISSDEIRKELFGDESDQKNHPKVFLEVEKRMLKALELGKDVIYDATNLSRKRRMHILTTTLREYDVVGQVLLTPIDVCMVRDENRGRLVGERKIKKMYKNFQFPFRWEGFREMQYYSQSETLKCQKEELELLMSPKNYEDFYQKLFLLSDEFRKVWEMPQDSTYHSFSVSRHIFHVYLNTLKNYDGEKKLSMMYAALFHDLGKGTCKSFVNHKGEISRYANFLGHENVSSIIAYHYLTNLKYEKEFILEVVELISLHMLPKRTSEKKLEQIIGWIGKSRYEDLMKFNDYDNAAK